MSRALYGKLNAAKADPTEKKSDNYTFCLKSL